MCFHSTLKTLFPQKFYNYNLSFKEEPAQIFNYILFKKMGQKYFLSQQKHKILADRLHTVFFLLAKHKSCNIKLTLFLCFIHSRAGSYSTLVKCRALAFPHISLNHNASPPVFQATTSPKLLKSPVLCQSFRDQSRCYHFQESSFLGFVCLRSKKIFKRI